MKMDTESKLKSVSVEKLQSTIATAVSELVGEPYDCAIDAIEYTRTLTVYDGANFSVSVHQHIDFSFMDKKPEQST
jgi:hypothetical protein